MAQVDIFRQRQLAFKEKFGAVPAPAALELMELTLEEASVSGRNYIGTEHILLAALRTPQSQPPLQRLGVSLTSVREAIELILGTDSLRVAGKNIGLTPRATKVIHLSVDEARRLGHQEVEPDHFLLGLVREGEGIAGGVLECLGVDLYKLRSTVLAERRDRIQAAQLETPGNPFENLAGVRSLLLDPSISPEDQQRIGAALKSIHQTYGPKRSTSS